eukprot:jgi/Undpi1/466/HiC_scaffold_1.g00462.m1
MALLQGLRAAAFLSFLPRAASGLSSVRDFVTSAPTPSPTSYPTGWRLTYNDSYMGTADFVDTPSPNEPIPKPACDGNKTVSIRYSRTSERLYLEAAVVGDRGGCVSIDEIWAARGGGAKGGAKAPLFAVDPETGVYSDTITGTWLLEESLYVEDGITLKVWGNASGGLCDELRLKSVPATATTNASHINLRAHGGSLDFENTRVFGWDTLNNSVDANEDDGRSYISAVSEVITDANNTCEGAAKNDMGEARMDIVSSEMGYLGYHHSESYGMTWKVRGFCKDKSNLEVFDEVAVYGNIYDSELHHCNFAVYTYGHQNGDWRRNVVHSNSGYGFDPHDDSDYLTIHDNIVYNNNWHGIIASKRCNNVSIQGNTVYGGNETSAGIFLHRSSDDAIVKNNHCLNNGDAGMAMLESSNASISGNVFEHNKYGVRMSVGCSGNMVSNNTIFNTTNYAIYTYLGSDPPNVGDNGFPQNNVFEGNHIRGGPQALKIKQASGTQIVNNNFSEPMKIEWQNSTGNVVVGNEGLHDNSTEVRLYQTCFDVTDEVVLAEDEC